MKCVSCSYGETAERIEAPNQERIAELGEKENYKYLGMLEADIIKKTDMKEKVRKEDCIRRKRLEIKLYRIKLLKIINCQSPLQSALNLSQNGKGGSQRD